MPPTPRARLRARPQLRSLLLAGLLAGLLITALTALVPAGPSGAALAGRLSVSPSAAVAGEPLTFRGAVPSRGRRPVVLQRWMNERWYDVARKRTNRRGGFGYRIAAHGTDTTYRVLAPRFRTRSGVLRRAATPRTSVDTLDQTAELRPATTPRAGAPVALRARFTPVRPGRPVLLQRRLSPTRWQTVATAAQNSSGQAAFTVTAPAEGAVVYRAVAGPWNGIASYWSFPTYVGPEADSTTGTRSERTVPTARSTYQPGPINAANTFGWFPTTIDHDWEQGQPLSPWREEADGTGRASIDWAMITLDSGPAYAAGHTGHVRATLGGTGYAYGRWEMRLRAPVFQTAYTDYRVKAELVPADGYSHRCGAQNLSMAEFTGYGGNVDLVARNLPNRTWTRSLTGVHRDRYQWHTYAVEVTPRRISWFVDAKVVATLRDPAAISGVPLTPRLSLEAAPGARMNRTRIGVDWVRYFTLDKPNKLPVTAPAPVAGTGPAGC